MTLYDIYDMSEHIRGSYDEALYKSTYTLHYFTICRLALLIDFRQSIFTLHYCMLIS